MGDQPGYVTPAGWYVDPATGTRLRWWSGLDWTEHFAPMTEHRPEPTRLPGGEPFGGGPSEPDGRTAGAGPAEAAGVSEAAAVSEEAAPKLSRRERRALEEEAAATRALPPPVTRIAPITSYAWDRESDRTDKRPSRMPSMAPEEVTLYRDFPSRWSTASVWTIAFMPWIAAVFGAAALLLAWWESAWWLQLGALALPFLLTLAAAQRDVRRLRSWRHNTVAHWAWSLLGWLGYLIARTVVLRRHAGLGSAPLWVGLANTLLVGAATAWLVAAAAANLTGFHEVIEADLGLVLEPTYGVVQVDCPDVLESLSFACTATDAGGAARSVWVELNAADGSYSYSVAE